jgi:two-component system sensor histidine kinase YesM
MNPHFLHNTLASIKSLAKLGRSTEIAEVVSRLGKILRAGAGRRDGMTTVGESVASVRDYLCIEKVRFGDRFSFRIELEPALEAVRIPPLTLEPLAENALTHGLERKRGKGTLRITGKLDGDIAVIEFEDDGPGMEAASLEKLSGSREAALAPSGSHGIGLLGTNRRIVLEYGQEYGIRISRGSSPSGGFKAALRIPSSRMPFGCTV